MCKPFKLKTLIFIFTLLQTYCGYAQPKNYKITYRHCVQYDTLKQITDTVGREAVLIGNSEASNYFYLRKRNSLPQKEQKSFDQIINQKTPGTNTYTINTGTQSDSIGNLLFFNKERDSIFLREKMAEGYILVFEKLPKINWIITKEIKIINNYKCVRANAYYRGRNYTAWFTNDIPIVEGPWKFKGLPGLLLSIEDDKLQVKIYATSVEYPVSEPVPSFYAIGKKISAKDYILQRDNDYSNTLKGFEQTVASQENFDRTGLSPKIKKQTALFGIEKRLD